MKKIILFLLIFCFTTGIFSQNVFHDLNVEIDVKEGSIKVIDIVRFKHTKAENRGERYFYLNKALNVICLDQEYNIINVEKNENEGINDEVIKYKIENAGDGGYPDVLPLSYEGIIKDEIRTGAAEYARGFSETKGIISEDGIYLAGSSYWVPYFPGEELISFSMNVMIDSAWGVVSQGERTVHDMIRNRRFTRYESPEPMDEVFLIAAPWTEYNVMAGDVLVQAFLRSPDEKLAARYLNVTSDYIKLYENLIGKYPYKKFALVENFWETGYGMPSFTLLGEKVIRFPWILHSSYPHELLHNYWGNSVYVDYENGNWCEGVTVYMADHLIKEQSGQGAEYRRNTLQKFTDFVNSENDFPLKEFSSRHNPAEEAIGYGKSMMINEMLRYDLGDEIFLKAYAEFYENNKFRKASFEDIRKSFEDVSKRDLNEFFEQWVNRTGAPSLKIKDVNVNNENDKSELSFKLTQIQEEEPFRINVPLAVYLEGNDSVIIRNLRMEDKEQQYSFSFDDEVVKIQLDPQYNIFRRLDKREVPNTLSQIMGSTEGIVILPGESKMLEAYKTLAQTWKQIQAAQGKDLKIINDDEIALFPKDQPVWVFGFENKFADYTGIPVIYFSSLNEDEKKVFSDLRESGSLVYALPNPENEELTIGFLATNVEKALEGLSRKLLHYGKYSYLGFEGEEPSNILKGIFPVVNSPLSITINDNEKVTARMMPRKALSSYVK